MIAMPLYLFHFAQIHNEFRLPELASVSELNSIPYQLSDVEEGRDPNRPFMVIKLEKEDHARTLARRCILIKYGFSNSFLYPLTATRYSRAVFEFYAQGASYASLHSTNLQNKPLWERYIDDTSFRFLVTSYQHKIPLARQRDVIESFAYMGFLGEIDMKHPEITLVCFEECWSHDLNICAGTSLTRFTLNRR